MHYEVASHNSRIDILCVHWNNGFETYNYQLIYWMEKINIVDKSQDGVDIEYLVGKKWQVQQQW